MCEIKNSKEVKLSDRVRFRCKRCGECCRHVAQTVVIEPIDAYNMSKYLKLEISKFYEKYTNMYLLENTVFPVFTLKTIGSDDACIFLKGNRCSIQESKPKTCRLYPFWVYPSENGFVYNYTTERSHHPNGSLVKVKDWMRDYFRDDEKEALNAEQLLLPRIAGILNALKPYSISDWEFILSKMLKYRHFAYKLTKPFQPQFETNMKELIEILNERLKTK